jgi:hypothetical protein
MNSKTISTTTPQLHTDISTQSGSPKPLTILITLLIFVLVRVDAQAQSQPSEDPAALCKQAEKLMLQHRYNDTILLMSQLIQADPSYQGGWFWRGYGFYYLRLSGGTLAPAVLPYLGKSPGEDVDSKQAQTNLALADLNQAIRLNPRDAHAWWVRARAYLDSNQFASASRDINQTISLDPQFAAAYAIRASIEYEQGEDGSADLARALELDPTCRNACAQIASYGQLFYKRTNMTRILNQAMNLWIHGATSDQRSNALSPWLAYGRVQTVILTYTKNNINIDFSGGSIVQSRQQFPAIGLKIKTVGTLPEMVIWIPVRQEDANLIPPAYRVPLQAPPGVAAWDPSNYTANMLTDLKIPTGGLADDLYLQHLKFP